MNFRFASGRQFSIYNLRFFMSDLQKMREQARKIRELYDNIEPKEWRVDQIFMGMVKDIGNLSKKLMVYEGYRDDAKNDIKELEHELGDILLSLFWIAGKLGIDLEKSFWRTAEELEKRLSNF